MAQDHLGRIEASWGVAADGTRTPDPGPDAPVLPAAARLAEVPGITPDLARAVIAETVLDMSRFPTAARLASWAGLAPVARQSGPRTRKPGKGHGDHWLKGYCTQAALGASKTATFLGERYRRLARRIGAVRAQCAVARSILTIVSLAPPEQPRCPVHRPRHRLARPQERPRPQDPPPPEGTPGLRLPGHPHRSRLAPATPLTRPDASTTPGPKPMPASGC